MIVKEVIEVIDRAIAPPMSQREALDFLDCIAAHIDALMDALREEIGDDED